MMLFALFGKESGISYLSTDTYNYDNFVDNHFDVDDNDDDDHLIMYFIFLV